MELLASASFNFKAVYRYFIFIFCFYISRLPAQDLSYARKVVDTLGSTFMHGRGYVNNGTNLAAAYISTEFKKLGLNSFKSSYYQEFKHPVNIFDKQATIHIDNKPLIPGTDFLIDPASPGCKGEYKIIWIKDKDVCDSMRTILLRKKLSNYAIIVDTTKAKSDNKYTVNKLLYNLNPKVLIFSKEKLTWGASTYQSNTTELLVLKNTIPENAEKIKIDIDNTYLRDFTSKNIIGYRKGTLYPDSFIIFSAHYDHLGRMGNQTYFPGANDNASGIAMLLNLAKFYSDTTIKPACSIVFIAFAGEELGLLGSNCFTENPLFPLNRIKFMINMDIMGTGDEGITVVNGSVYPKAFELLSELNAHGNFLKQVKVRGKAKNSDHYFFSEKGVPSFFIYTMGGISAYHDIYDRPETLPLTEFEDLFKLLTLFVNKL